jgi:uncharacterized protein DUF6152
MKNKFIASLSLIPAYLLFCLPAVAHHGTNTEYDSDHPITVVGTVTEFAFSNPHVQIYFDVKDAKGNVTHWGVESASPGRLVRVGWNRNIIKPGDQLTITLEPARSGQPVGGLKKVVFPDGRVLGGSATAPPGQQQ